MTRLLTLFCIFLLTSCFENEKEGETIQIGHQIWLKRNLDVVTFRNGDTIPEAKTDEEWEQARFAEQPAWCYFRNDRVNGNQLGKLYNWYAINDKRGLAPKGWHVPGDVEWTEMLSYTKGKMFYVQRGGTRTFIGEFEKADMGFWWSATGNEIYDKQYAWYRVVGTQNDSLHRATYVKGCGFSVRCLKDQSN